ncbi:MAG: SDR family NAD(P)-dependent oxidoreductase [Rhodothermales bacterium]
MNPQGKRVVVTGGSSGIGLALAHAFAETGGHVVITGRSEARLIEAAASHANLTGMVCDVTRDDQVVALREHMNAGGGTDILVNNAGVMHAFDVTSDFPLETQLQEIDIDVAGPVRLVHHFLPGMLQREAMIVNVSSGLAYIPYAAAPVYSASKAFLHAYTQSLRAQLAGSSVRVVELLPPVVDTPLADGLDPSFARMPPEKLAATFLREVRRGQDEITPGQSRQLKWMSRLAPSFMFGQLNKSPRG